MLLALADIAKGMNTPSGKRQTSRVPLDAWVDASIDFVLVTATPADARCGQTLRNGLVLYSLAMYFASLTLTLSVDGILKQKLRNSEV